MNKLKALTWAVIIFPIITWSFLLFEFSYKEVDINLQPYYDSYTELVKKRCPKATVSNFHSIKFDKSLRMPSWVGYCQNRFISGYKIRILRHYWNSISEDEKTQLMFHELAHCIIHKEHESQLPGHYMYDYMSKINPQVFLAQVEADIDNYCVSL